MAHSGCSGLTGKTVAAPLGPGCSALNTRFFKLRRRNPPVPGGCRRKEGAPVLSLKETESRLIRETLEYTRGNITRAAALLKISRSALYRRIGKLHISR